MIMSDNKQFGAELGQWAASNYDSGVQIRIMFFIVNMGFLINLKCVFPLI
jgi:hypothetical protein